MVDVVLVVTSVILAILVIIASIYFLVYFQHPEDKWVAWFPKIVVVLGISLSCYNVLLLPLDVANQRKLAGSEAGGIPMGTIDLAFFITSILLALIVVPFTMFYYEGVDDSDDIDTTPDVTKQVLYALKWCSIFWIIYFLATGLLWYYYGYADIPLDIMGSTLQSSSAANPADVYSKYCYPKEKTYACTNSENQVQQVRISFPMYMVVIGSLIGWIFFSVFGGVGLVALPFDLILDFRDRPRPIKLEDYTAKKKLVGEQAELLLRASQVLTAEMKSAAKQNTSRRKMQRLKRQENEFKRDVLFLETQYRKLEDAYKNGGGNPLVHFSKLIIGIVGCGLSLFWLLHLIIYVLPRQAMEQGRELGPFLNAFFESTFTIPVIGIVFYGMFAFWLLACVLKGCITVGVRLLFISIHPMKVGETVMTSFVFNVGIILFCSLAVVQFCAVAFSEYARYTATLALFSSQIHYVRYLKYVYDVLIFALPIFAVVTAIYMSIRPRDYSKKKIIL